MRSSSLLAYSKGKKILLDNQESLRGRGTAVAEGFFALADFLRKYPKVSLALTNPSRNSKDKLVLMSELGLVKVADSVIQAVNQEILGLRWSKPYDLIIAWEKLGTRALLQEVVFADKMQLVSDQVFSVTEYLAGNRAVRIALSDRKGRNISGRIKLAEELFAPQVDGFTLLFLKRAIITLSGIESVGEHRSLTSRLRHYQALLAEQLNADVVTVSSAVALEPAQIDRLRKILKSQLGRAIVLNVMVEPKLIGGFRLQIGEKTYDASILSALTKTKQKMAG